jgi:hypothetical protein
VEKIQELQDPVWERQPGESPVSYAAFRAYRDLSEGRTIEKAVDILIQKWPDIPQRDPRSELSRNSYLNRAKHWSSERRWVERAEAYDAHLDGMLIEAREHGMQRMANRLEGRIESIKEMEWAIGSKAYEQLKEFMEMSPVGRTETKDGKTIHYHPNPRWTQVAPAIMREASRLIRLSVDMPTEGARAPTPKTDQEADSDVHKFLSDLGGSGEAAPSADLPDATEPS